MIESLLANRPAWIQLGLVLAHFLWQGAAIAVVLATMLWFLRRRSPDTRYGLCGLAMLTMAACPVLTLQYVRTHQLPLLAEPRPAAVIPRTTLPDEPDVLRSDPAGAADPVGDPLSAMLPGLDGASDTSGEEASSSSASPGLQAVGEREALWEQGDNHSVDDSRATTASPTAGLIMRLWLPRGLELAALAWLIGVAVLSVRLVIGWLRLRRQYRRDTEGLPEAIEAVVRRLSERLGIARRVRVVAARAWDEPIAFGLLRPVVLMPVAMLTQCPVELIEAMIAHELAHIRRHDLWVNVFQRVVETVLFYHPAVWWVSGRMRLERELCCDDLAIYATGRRADYASALVELCRVQPGLVTPALAAGVFGPKLSLLTRVRRVLQASPLARESNRGRFWLAGPLSILLAGVFVLVAGLRTAAPQDAVAAQPVATRPADAAQHPEEKKTYTFNWNRQPLSKVLAELQEKTGLSMSGIEDLGDSVSKEMVNFTSVRPVGFDEALLLVNHLIQDKGPGYWILRRDQCLEIRDVVSWFRRVPPAQMFTTEEAYRKVDLPKWEMASVVYQPRHASAKSLADRAMDEVPDNTARARPTPDGSRIELKGIVEYIDQQLEIIKKWDVPQDDLAVVLMLDKAAEDAGRICSRYGGLVDPSDELSKLSSRAPGAVYSAGPPNVPVHARTDGVTVEVKVKNGQAVKKDDLLARFDDEEIKIDLTAAEIRFDECSKKLERLRGRGPVPPGPVPSEEMEKAESAARLAELDLQRCKLRLDRTQIKSPADGVVVGRGAPENDVALLVNQQVKAGELLMYIRPTEQRSSAGGPESTFGGALRPKAANGSAVATRPEDATSLTELLDRRSPWLPQAQAGLEKAIRELEAAKEELRSSRFMTENHPRLMQLKKRIEDLRNALSPSVAAKKVYAQADGVVAEVKVREGQAVKKDDLLVQLDAEEIKLERMAAQVKYDQAQTELERLAKLKEHSAVGQFEYQKVATDAKLAEIEVRRLDLRLSRTRITSPADGKVRATEGSVSDLVGQRVTAGDLLLYVEPADSAQQADTRPSDSSSRDERSRRGRSPDERPREGRN